MTPTPTTRILNLHNNQDTNSPYVFHFGDGSNASLIIHSLGNNVNVSVEIQNDCKISMSGNISSNLRVKFIGINNNVFLTNLTCNRYEVSPFDRNDQRYTKNCVVWNNDLSPQN